MHVQIWRGTGERAQFLKGWMRRSRCGRWGRNIVGNESVDEMEYEGGVEYDSGNEVG
jgi:hypothetical protein